MAPTKINFKLYQGATFNEILRWESSKKSYANISAITKAAPCVITAVAHGIPDGWRCTISNVIGMKEINSTDYVIATFKDVDNIELNTINSSGYSTYTSGGVIEYAKPVTLTGYTARMQIREKITDTSFIDELTTENGKIVLNNTNKTIQLLISATVTAAYTFNTAVYSLELIETSTGIVIPFAVGNITLVKEVTR